MLHELLNLDRPLVCLDLETTGIDVRLDRIVQIGIVKVYVDGRTTEWETLVNPGIPIPAEASAVHGITDFRVAAAPSFAELAHKLSLGLKDCDLAGYNHAAFDVKLLTAEFSRVNPENPAWTPNGSRLLDGFRIFQRMSPRNLSAATKEYLGTDLIDAHSALADARASLQVIAAQLQRHTELPRSLHALHEMFFVLPRDANVLDPDGRLIWKTLKPGEPPQACINFGANKGKSLREMKALNPSFLTWIIRNDFNAIVRNICADALEGRFPVKESA